MKRRSWIGIKLVMVSAGFLGLTIAEAFCVRSMSIDPAQVRGPASIEYHSVFEHRGALSAVELGMLGSTILTRGRKVEFHEQQFRDAYAHSHGLSVPLNLFPDLTLQVKFQDPSNYNVNQDIFAGQVEGDPDSEVKFMILDHVLDGTIKTKGREYRIVQGASGLHIVTEAPPK